MVLCDRFTMPDQTAKSGKVIGALYLFVYYSCVLSSGWICETHEDVFGAPIPVRALVSNFVNTSVCQHICLVPKYRHSTLLKRTQSFWNHVYDTDHIFTVDRKY